MTFKPRIILVPGDPCGIGPETTAKLLARPEVRDKAEIILITDREVWAEGQRVAQVEIDCAEIDCAEVDCGEVDCLEVETLEGVDFRSDRPVLLHLESGSNFPYGRVSRDGGKHCLDTLKLALEIVARGQAGGICFGPLNKEALHLAGMETGDELGWLAQQLKYTGPMGHLTVLDNLWTSRVTSHMALRDVPAQITQANVLEKIELVYGEVVKAGVAEPRIAVAALNPHGGEGGIFGDEETEAIAPALEAAKAAGIKAIGPIPGDTVFLRALKGEFDAVVSMYHDQGQIAAKLVGFDRGVCVQGGLPRPITTPSHGTAFDIAGQGLADDKPLKASFELVRRMVEEKSKAS